MYLGEKMKISPFCFSRRKVRFSQMANEIQMEFKPIQNKINPNAVTLLLSNKMSSCFKKKKSAKVTL